MTLNFAYYHASDTAPIRTDHVKGYAADSKRNIKRYYFRKHPLAKKMREWLTFWTVALAVGSLFASHCIYA